MLASPLVAAANQTTTRAYALSTSVSSKGQSGSIKLCTWFAVSSLQIQPADCAVYATEHKRPMAVQEVRAPARACCLPAAASRTAFSPTVPPAFLLPFCLLDSPRSSHHGDQRTVESLRSPLLPTVSCGLYRSTPKAFWCPERTSAVLSSDNCDGPSSGLPKGDPCHCQRYLHAPPYCRPRPCPRRFSAPASYLSAGSCSYCLRRACWEEEGRPAGTGSSRLPLRRDAPCPIHIAGTSRAFPCHRSGSRRDRHHQQGLFPPPLGGGSKKGQQKIVKD